MSFKNREADSSNSWDHLRAGLENLAIVSMNYSRSAKTSEPDPWSHLPTLPHVWRLGLSLFLMRDVRESKHWY